MVSVYIFIDNEIVQGCFYCVLNEVGFVLSEMIEVKIEIIDGVLLKVVCIDCLWVIFVFCLLNVVEDVYD